MQVEILSIPSGIRALDMSHLKAGDVFEIYRASVAEDADNHWFTFGPKKQFEVNLDALIINGIEFKVVHAKA